MHFVVMIGLCKPVVYVLSVLCMRRILPVDCSVLLFEQTIEQSISHVEQTITNTEQTITNAEQTIVTSYVLNKLFVNVVNYLCLNKVPQSCSLMVKESCKMYSIGYYIQSQSHRYPMNKARVAKIRPDFAATSENFHFCFHSVPSFFWQLLD